LAKFKADNGYGVFPKATSCRNLTSSRNVAANTARRSPMTLDQLGIHFGTDKSSIHHDYLRFYEGFFQAFKNSPIRLLEIGILDGASLKTWERYFKSATIVGADINPSAVFFEGGRTAVEIVDQSNIEELICLATKYGPFDIIIEDGSHLWEHQVTSLRTLFPFLKPNGIYIVEDLQTNFGEMIRLYQGVAKQSCVEYLKRIVDYRVADAELDIRNEEDAFIRTYARFMNLTFYRRACIIQKVPVQSFGKPLSPGRALVAVDNGAQSKAFHLVAHIGNCGDISSEYASITSLVAEGNIQGFSLRMPGQQATQLQYRARLEDGSWTEWVEAGAFVGTRGVSVSLTGFSVRVSGQMFSDNEVELIGVFRAREALVRGKSNEDCISADGMAPLYGMQLVLRTKTLGGYAD